VAELLVCLGFFLIYLLEELIQKCVTRHSRVSDNGDSMVLGNVAATGANGIPNGTANGNGITGHGIDNPAFHADPEAATHLEVPSPTSHGDHSGHDHGHGHSHLSDLAALKAQTRLAHAKSLILVLALSFHAIFEGMAVGLQEVSRDVWFLLFAMCAHKLVLSFCIGVELLTGGTRRGMVILYVAVFAIVSPLGIAIGIVVTETDDGAHTAAHVWTVAVLQAMAAGTILYVTFCEVLERERSRAEGRLRKWLWLAVGFAVMAGMEALGGHSHSH